VSAVTEDLSDAGIERALREGPYGRCVYACDNDQPACQLTTVELAGGVLASVSMQGHAHKDSRLTTISGSRGTLVARFSVADMKIEVFDQVSGEVERSSFPFRVEMHGGGDERLMEGFVRAAGGQSPPVTPRESLEGHLMAFAAERSAREGVPVTLR
jgi:hypothetical protein